MSSNLPKRLLKMAEENQDKVLSSTRRSQMQECITLDNELDPTLINRPGMDSFSQHRSPSGNKTPESTNSLSSNNWEETQIGFGRHSKIPEIDDIENDDVLQQYEDLRFAVEYYGTRLQIEESDWQKHVNTEYDRLHSEITSFQRQCITKQKLELVSKVEQLFTDIVNFKHNLTLQASNNNLSLPTNQQFIRPSRILAGIQSLSTPNPESRVLNTPGNNDVFGTPAAEIESEGGAKDLADSLPGIIDEVTEARLSVLSALGDDRNSVKPSSSDDMLPKILDLYNKIMASKELQSLLSGGKETNSHQKETISNLQERIEVLEQHNNMEKSELSKFKADVSKCLKTLDQDVQEIAATSVRYEGEIQGVQASIKNIEASLGTLSKWIESVASRSQPATTSQQRLNLSPILNRESAIQSVRNSDSPRVRPNINTHRAGRASDKECGNNILPNLVVTRPIGERTNRANTPVDSPSNDSVSSKTSNSDASLIKVHETKLDRGIKNLQEITGQIISSSLSDDIIVDLYTNVVRDVERLAKECDDKLISYAKLSDHCEEKITSVEQATETAFKWVSDVKNIYRSRQLHLQSSANKAFTGSLNIKKFSAQSSDTVFEFFKKFEQFTRASYTLDQKAMLLYASYLDDKLKQELVPLSGSYNDMKEWLVKRFGRVKGIVDSKIESIKSKKMPSESANPTQQADYLRHVYSVLASIQGLPASSSIDPTNLAMYAYSHETLCQILKHLPPIMVSTFLKKIVKKDMDREFFQGEEAFKIAMELVQTEFSNMVTAAKLTSNPSKESNSKEKPRRRSSGSLDTRTKVHNVVNSPQSSRGSVSDSDGQAVHHQASIKSNPKKPTKSKWYNDKLTFPCPLSKHDHELGTCEDFFKLTPWNRRKVGFRKMCYCCMKPFDKCSVPCKNQTRVPVRMVCQECVINTDEKKTPSNILLCGLKEHSKLESSDLIKECTSYLKDFNAALIKSGSSSSANLVAVTTKCKDCKHKQTECSCSSHPSFSSPVDQDHETPSINTSNGETIVVDDDVIVHENPEESFYIMQMFDIRGEECLTFFDRGANQHLIEGSLAEKTNLKVLNPRSTPIGVVGGGRIWTQYGMYCLNIGPTLEGNYHEVKCQGITNVTEEMPRYDLSEINKSVKSSGKLSSNDVLPKFIGGSRVKLLLGIKDAVLDPVSLFVLPCGLGVYQSQLLDKFNSRICYGGPHTLFTEVNNKTGGNFNHINIFFTEMVNSYKNSLYPMLAAAPLLTEDDDEIPIEWPKRTLNIHCIKADNELDIVIYPTPITPNDMQVFDPDITVEDHSERTESRIMETEDSNLETSIDHCSDSSSRIMATEGSLAGNSVHHCSVHKAKVPISKLVKIVDEDDIDKIVNYRCSSCSKCVKCLQSNRTKTMSLQESIEQDVIVKSIKIDTPGKRVWVSYPFTQEPIEFLKKYHNGGSDNRYQAIKAYKQQCRKPEKVKDGIRLAHQELVDKGFMTPLSNLSCEQQKQIKDHAFKHFYPWSSVVKDSISTPVRLVVDPSRTGLNNILAKGENNMAKIYEVVVRNRCKREIFTSDISKLYNQLHLEDSALPYSLFLFSSDLDQDKEPIIFVLTRAWYGVRSTGNQSGTALEFLAEEHADDFPLAKEVIQKDRYVDDVLSGSSIQSEREEQIKQVEQVLKAGGFSLKFIARSGHDPPQNASSDGKSMKILGYKWVCKDDLLSPGFSELNFNKKSRGMRDPNEIRMDSVDNVDSVLANTVLTRRIVISKIAELYDPIGIWEPLKLQLKLDAVVLNGMNWDAKLPEDLQNHWKSKLKEFLDIPLLSVPRCVIPDNAADPMSVRLLCFSDAAVAAGGAAIYASYKVSDSEYSCKLLTSKSKLMDGSIPRNELSAVLLMAELAFLIKKALGSMVTEVLYFTDSTIALSWCHNVNKKLRMFVFNRVSTIRRFIDWTTGQGETIPLYHIPGPENIADLLTKEHQIRTDSISKDSEWQNGKCWMKGDLKDMPITQYSDLAVTETEAKEISSECFIELDPETENPKEISKLTAFLCTSCDVKGKDVDTNTNPVSEHIPKEVTSTAVFATRKSSLNTKPPISVISIGWYKAVRQMTVLAKFVAWIVHKAHSRSKNHDVQLSLQSRCKICLPSNDESNGTARQTRNQDANRVQRFLQKDNLHLGENVWFRFASQELESYGISTKVLDTFVSENGIYYYTGRLSEEFPVTTADLDINVFFDNQDFRSVLPVVHSKSPVFYAYLLYVHDHLRPHSGIELTYREISKKMYVLNKPRNLVQKLRKDCQKCKIIFKKTLDLEMASHSAHRTILSPPFHAVQIDIAYKFKGKPWKNARQTFDVYALVVVCLLSSATSILVLEGLETADVVLALERHSYRYGVPKHVYVDAGSQLVTLQGVTFSLRDVNLELHLKLGLTVKVSNPKSHEERGRVEAKVKVLRSMLTKLSINPTRPMTTVSWETLFAKIANDVDNLPICKGNASNLHDFGFDIITPNRLKLGRNNSRSLDDSFLIDGVTEPQLLEVCRKYKQVWYQILLDRLHYLIPKCKKWSKTDDVSVGDVVVFVHKDSGIEKRWDWVLGKVVHISVDQRSLTITYFPPGRKGKLDVQRSPRQVSKIYSADDIPVNTIEYYEKNVLM